MMKKQSRSIRRACDSLRKWQREMVFAGQTGQPSARFGYLMDRALKRLRVFGVAWDDPHIQAIRLDAVKDAGKDARAAREAWNDFLEDEGQELIATFGDID